MRFLSLAIFTILLNHNQNSNRKVFDDFHTAYKNRNFDKINRLLDNDFRYTDEYRNLNKSTYLQFLTGWCQVFETTWQVKSVKELENQIQAVEYDSDIYNYFYSGIDYKTFLTYTFKKGKITQLEAKTEIDKNSNKVVKERMNKFADWIEIKYPSKVRYWNSFDKVSATEIKLLLEEYLKTVR